MKKNLGVFLCSIYMLQNATYFAPKNADKFICKYCQYKCCKPSDWNRHVLTLKHQNATKMLQNATYFTPKSANLICCDNCNKKFKHTSSMYRHKNKCNINKLLTCKNSEDTLVNFLMKENSELKGLILDVCKNTNNQIINTTTNTNNNVNSNNKTFNLNVFLNEHCKDAMNITEFVDSLQIQLSDLENVGKLGYVNGISKIIINKLNALDETKRPIHCTDSKREILYIKDENRWEKYNDNNNKIRKVIKRIAHKNCKLIPEFKEKHPDCNKSESRYSDQYNKMIVEAMGGSGDNNVEKEDKIIKNIAKEVQINKSIY
jgi:hypothetical protein